jgi:hypothetical protein
MDQTRLEAKSIAKGFFLGFVGAQFVSGWISGPLILIIIIVYIFIGQAMQQVGDAITARMPAFLVNSLLRFTSSGKTSDPAVDQPHNDFWSMNQLPANAYSPFFPQNTNA